jgi:hypothetical protein
MFENQNKPKKFKIPEDYDFTIPDIKPQINGVALSVYNCKTKTTTEYKITVDRPEK